MCLSGMPSLPLRSVHGHHSDHRVGGADVHRLSSRCDHHGEPVRGRSQAHGHGLSHGNHIDVLVCRRRDWYRSLQSYVQPQTRPLPCGANGRRANNRRVHRARFQYVRSRGHVGDHGFRGYGSLLSPSVRNLKIEN